MADIVKRQWADHLPAILSPAAEAYLRAALSDNTQRAYRAQIVRWTEWCAEQGGKAWPADLVVVVNYLSQRADAGQRSTLIGSEYYNFSSRQPQGSESQNSGEALNV
jgi:hypothetical protein